MATIPDLDKYLTDDLRRQRRDMMEKRGLSGLGFYDQLMAYPALFAHMQALGTFIRFESVLPARVREAEVLMVATELRSALEWQTHCHSGAAAGVQPALFTAIGDGAPLEPFGDALHEVREVVRCVVAQQSVPQPLFDSVIATFGVPGAVEVVTLAAMYRMYASLGAAFDSVEPGAAPPPWAEDASRAH